MPFNLLKSELRYCNPFQNASMTSDGMSLIFSTKLVAVAMSLEDCKVIYQVNKPFHPCASPEIFVKIGPF